MKKLLLSLLGITAILAIILNFYIAVTLVRYTAVQYEYAQYKSATDRYYSALVAENEDEQQSTSVIALERRDKLNHVTDKLMPSPRLNFIFRWILREYEP